MFRQIKWLQSSSKTIRIFIRNKSVIIRQVETTKMSRAEKIKNQNFETSNLYGPRTKLKKENIVAQLKATDDRSNGKSSEMYWILGNNNTKKSKKLLDQIKENEQEEQQVILKTKKKKTALEKEEKLPETFAKFKLDLPKPVKVTIQNALDNINSNRIDMNKNVMKEIPFDQKQLRSMINFPLILQQNDVMTDIFNKTLIMERKIDFTPSVSKVLQATMSASQRSALIQWKNLKIAELGQEGFQAMQEEYLNRGKLFHNCLQKYFNNIEINEDNVPSNTKELWKSISHVLCEFQVPAIATEQSIFHPHLRYKGIVDCISVHHKSSTLSVIEWKNSDRHKKTVSSTYDAPLQLCAYLAALNATQFKDKPLKSGIIVVAYNDGQSADLFHLSHEELNIYWKKWLNRLQEYWISYRDNTLANEEI
ncbi:hypothetical protein PVAND_016160 [Polypedilum vanderplanki]|uniref:Mitochondrial genome maintenance exonuclease 1 n=1 Tax=Polypedilum vanderplanki TaxID=319348 RepID=A0A9J6BEB0_POLVA|nr:hypothetical protein PVAND_016160 [Polypedilum vanderplanki]